MIRKTHALIGIIALLLFSSMTIVGAHEGKTTDNLKNFEYERVIVSNMEKQEMEAFRNMGCIMKHLMKESASFECPEGITISLTRKNTRKARIFRITDLYADQQTGADMVWAEGITGNGVSIAILDTGIDTDHPELMDSYLGGYDFVNDDPVPEDDHGHGTHVAGIITSDGDSDPVSIGAAPRAGIYVYKVCDSGGSCYEDDMMAAMEAAVQAGAEVMSISIGGGVYTSENCDSDPLAAKVNWAIGQGLTAVIAAGNNGRGVSSPGCASGAIAVGAVDITNNVPYWSGRGPALDIVAPGVSIYSTYLNGGYGSISGTSMATPHVTGVVSLLLDSDPTLTTSEIKAALYDTADPVNNCYGCRRYSWWGSCYGYGEISCTSSVTGAGVVDAYGAYLSVKSGGTEPPEPPETDYDGDGVPDPEDECPEEHGTYCSGCPEPECTGCQVSQCPADGQPLCLDDSGLCTAENADGTCVSGVCSYECHSGFKNCNEDWIDGCETDVMSDSSNCGDCGNACGEVACPESGCGAGGCGADEYGTYSVSQQSSCTGGFCSGECGVTCAYDPSCDQDDDDDGVSDVDDSCPAIHGTFCNGCPDPCSGCAIAYCPPTGSPTCNPGYCPETACPGGACGEGSCDYDELPVYTPVPNECILNGNAGTCTTNPCTLECVYDLSCEPEPPEPPQPGLCWDGDNHYMIRGGSQFKKFCKCAEGTYAYISYGYAWGKLAAYQYVDSSDNDNWQVSPIHYYFPAYRIKCADGNWYYLDQDY